MGTTIADAWGVLEDILVTPSTYIIAGIVLVFARKILGGFVKAGR